MAQQYKTYPIERMQPLPSTSSKSSKSFKSSSILRPQSKPTPSVTTNNRYNQISNKYTTSSNTHSMNVNHNNNRNMVYKSSSNNNNNSNYRALSAMAKTKNESNKYVRGVIIVAPQNESTHGWIYSKTTNTMYQLPFNPTKHYIPDQIVLFNPSSKLRGLSLSEARMLMVQNKLNINNYGNYFVNDMISNNIYHTKLITLDEIHKNYLTEDSESMYNKNKYILNTFINLSENQEIEFKLFDTTKTDKMVNIMERYLNGFINMNGGTIYFGINDDARIIGQNLYNINPRKFVDEIQLKICEKLREWKPAKYTQKLIKSIKIEMIDIIKIDDDEKVGFIIPNKKIIKVMIKPIIGDNGDNGDNKQIIFSSSSCNNNVVYVRQLSSLCAYIDNTMQQQIGKRQIFKLNKPSSSTINGGNDDQTDSDIDFDDDDEKDWIDVDKFRNDIKYHSKNGTNTYFDGRYTQSITKMFQNIQNSLPI